tara:strand:+ start:2012 stop:2782 length:771 start_codon:yes stop_codon:yes gene_type:complete
MANEEKNNDDLKVIKWGDENEKILKSWADEAQCFSLMHDRAYKRFYGLNAWFSIPVIILSTITGTGNFAQSSINKESRKYFIMAIGAANLISAIIVSVAQFLRVAQESEGNLRSHIDWDKYGRKIKIELSKVREDRIDCNTFITSCQEEYDRLLAGSPNIPTDVIRWFKNDIINKKGKDEVTGCQLCMYQCCCFPFGIECCNKPYCNNCNCGKDKDDNDIENNKYSDIEIPEIVDGIKRISINSSSGMNEYEIYKS